MCGRWFLAWCMAMVCTVGAVAEEPAPPADTKPPYERLLTGDDAARAAELQKQIDAAVDTDRYDEALRLHEDLLALRTRVQGADHWQTSDQTWALDLTRKISELPRDELAGWRKAVKGVMVAQQLEQTGQYARAEPLWREHRRWCERVLGQRHPETFRSYSGLGCNLGGQVRYAEAEPLFQRARNLQRELRGERHPDTAMSYNNLACSLNYQGRHAEAQPLYQKALDLFRELLGERDPKTAMSYDSVGLNLTAQRKYVEAQPLLQKALNLRRARYGERHADTAWSYNSLGYNLYSQEKYAEAQPLLQRALELHRELFGERHLRTATGYHSLASNLAAQGKYAEAQSLEAKGLDIRRELLGERHAETASSYDGLASSLYAQGKYAEAQPLLEKAILLRRELLGERHPDTLTSYDRLAGNLNAQQKYAEAQPLFEKVLQMDRDLYGERHLNTAKSYDHLASNLDHQARFAEAEPLHRKALDVRRELHGERHPDTARSYNNLAGNISVQGRYSEAQVLYEHALDLLCDLLGERHRDTATTCCNLGRTLDAQGKHALAQSLHERALSFYREVLGERHPHTVAASNCLAFSLHAQGHYPEALALLVRAAAAYEAARLGVAERGLDRAVYGSYSSPYPLLAAAQARRDEPAAAWLAVEWDLARGLSDAGAPRGQVALTLDEQRRKADLNDRLDDISPRIIELLTKQSPTAAELDELSQLKGERETLEAEQSQLAVTVSQRELATLEQVQSMLPLDAALVLWVDFSHSIDGVQEHWGCVVRSAGDPHWGRLPGSGPGGTWSVDEWGLAANLKAALSAHAPATEIEQLAGRLYRLRVAPLEQYLDGIRRLYVVPVGDMAGVPTEMLTDRFTVSYAPSGTFLARSGDQPARGGGSLLALGDPTFPKTPSREPSALPAGGLLITQIMPGRILARTSRGGDWAELPGTSVEVARLQSLVGADQTTALTRSDASEQALEQLRAAGKLKDFRYLHFATHGEPNNAQSFESALILAQDQITGEIPKGGGKYYDGRLTANEVLENWELGADLVTLSACESALGRPGGGDGLLGFAQAFLLAGARSVCLSLWKVDDTATALLMDRFYQNLLGKREGLEGPMPKAEALTEAKQWLRNLTVDEATKLAADLTQGAARGKNEPALALAVPDAAPQTATATDNHPFAHPRYWAAFVLIGDPD